MSKYLFAVLFCFCVLLPDFCMAREKDDCGCVNEYNNSTIYYGTTPGTEFEQQQEGIRVYRDPETGDRITDVRARRAPTQQQQQYPIIVEPRIGSW